MSIARHHNEWLSLLESSGSFLSMPVLLHVFLQGQDALDKAQALSEKLAQAGVRRVAYPEAHTTVEI